MGLILDYLVFIIYATLRTTRPISDFVLDVFTRIFYGGTKPLPPIGNKILLMSATELAERIRKKKLSAVEVMQAYIDRIEAVQPIVNACVDNRYQEAMAEARAVDWMLGEGSKTEGELAVEAPLLGVPFTCKEIIGVKRLAQTCGLLSLKNRKAPEDSDTAALYRKAGAIPVVVTNIPTMSLWLDTSNPLFGATKNPYSNNRTPGGSSGGEASLISSAGAVMGIGHDLGGSIRLPASFCGIYGHKPSQGVISNKTSAPISLDSLEPFVSTGPLCRYAEDLPLLVKVLSGNDKKKLRLDEQVRFSNLKVYYMEEFPGYMLSSTHAIKTSVRKAVKHFEEEYGVTPKKLKIKELKYATSIWLCKLFEAAGPFVRTTLAGESGKFNLLLEYLKCVLGFSEYDYRIMFFLAIEIQKRDKFYYQCLDMYNTIDKKLKEVLDGDAILILPVHPEPPPHCIVTIPKFGNVAYTCIFNILGLPGTTVPAGFSMGVPIGLQVMAAKNNDRLSLASAVELDKVFGGWKSPCPIVV